MILVINKQCKLADAENENKHQSQFINEGASYQGWQIHGTRKNFMGTRKCLVLYNI